MKDLIIQNHEILLCRGKGCCPKIKRVNEGQVLITDDEGNKVVLTNEQALMVPEALNLLQNND